MPYQCDPCYTCSAGQTRAKVRLSQRRSGSVNIQVFREGHHVGHARGGHTTMETAREPTILMHAALFGSVHRGHRAYRRGLLQLCPLVGHLDRRELFGGVGAR